MSKSVRRPSPALIVAVIAVVAALTGSALALPGKNSVDSGDIKKNSVRSPDIKKNGVKTSDIANGAVTSSKIAAGVIPSVPAQLNFAWAKVNANQTLADQVGSVSLVGGGVGIYCFDLPFPVRFAVATPAASAPSHSASVQPDVPDSQGVCPTTHKDVALYASEPMDFFIYFG